MIDSDLERSYNQPPEGLCLKYMAAIFYNYISRSSSPPSPRPHPQSGESFTLIFGVWMLPSTSHPLLSLPTSPPPLSLSLSLFRPL